MAEDIKFTDEELKSIEGIRTQYAEITNRVGQITLTKYNLDLQEKQAHKDFEAIRAEEQKIKEEQLIKKFYSNNPENQDNQKLSQEPKESQEILKTDEDNKVN